MEILTLLAIFGVGLFAGFINVIVGSGSSITVPFLTFMGLPPVMSIGTNRFAMLFNNGLGGLRYYQKKYLNVKVALILSVFASIGSIIGAYWVLGVGQEILNKVIAVILIIEAAVILCSRKRLGLENSLIKLTKKHYLIGSVLCLMIGVYGGFIGMAITSIIMFILVMLFRVRFIESAAITKVVTFSISFFASIIFLAKLKVDLVIASVLVVAYLAGAYAGVHSAIRMGDIRIKVLLILVVLASAVKLLFF